MTLANNLFFLIGYKRIFLRKGNFSIKYNETKKEKEKLLKDRLGAEKGWILNLEEYTG